MSYSLRSPARPAGQFNQPASSARRVSKLCALAAAASIFCAGSLARAQTGGCVLDAAFDRDGKVTTNLSDEDVIDDIAIQSDGKIVVAGSAPGNVFGVGYPSIYSRFALARYNSDGSLDRSFGQNGRIITGFGQRGEEAHAVAIQPDGKIVAAGTGGDSVLLARYQSDGSLDTTFGVGGKVITFDTKHDSPRFFYRGNAIALQPGGKIVVAGYVVRYGDNLDFALFRYNSDGSMDTTFSDDGIVDDDFLLPVGDAEAWGVVIQTDGKIVAAGQAEVGLDRSDFVLERFNDDGSLDSTFGSGGLVSTDFGTNILGISIFTIAYDLVLQPDGKLIAAGGAINDPLSYRISDFALARYNTDGSLDSSFGVGGKVTTLFGGFSAARGVLLQPDGKIVAAGGAINDPLSYRISDFALARYNTDGQLDTTFGVGGKMTTDFFGVSTPSGGDGDRANAVARQPDGKIIAAGFAERFNSDEDFALARYSPDASSSSHDLVSLALSSHKVAGCQTLKAVVTLCGPAPSGGVEVALTDSLAAASVPATVTVPEGQTSAAFDITTMPVSSLQTGLIAAHLDGITRRMPLVLRPVGVQSIRVNDVSPIYGSSTIPIMVTLECAAPSGGVWVALSSRNPAIAAPTTGRIFIPAGSTSGIFYIRTGDVTTARQAIIEATAHGVSKGLVITVYPHP